MHSQAQSKISPLLQLPPGALLFPEQERTLLLRTASDDFIRVHGSPETLALFRAVASSTLTPEHALAAAADPGELADLITACQREGVLLPRPEPTSLPTVAVGVLDTNPLAEATAAVLTAAGLTVLPGATADLPCDLLLSCAGWLPDSDWLALAERCLQLGRPWQMAYAEGDCWYIGPLLVPGITASYRDVRLRRLAAADRPEELLRCWQWLAAERPAPTWPDAAGRAMLAGIIAQDILTWARGEPVASIQHAVHLASLTIEHHPVLPLPLPPRTPHGEASA
ncbi:MAG: hypothetical protein K6U89_12810 [Chloroflexi bacterium]|nr:hypothetical protein [Chloroflexota bacterium]